MPSLFLIFEVQRNTKYCIRTYIVIFEWLNFKKILVNQRFRKNVFECQILSGMYLPSQSHRALSLHVDPGVETFCYLCFAQSLPHNYGINITALLACSYFKKAAILLQYETVLVFVSFLHQLL